MARVRGVEGTDVAFLDEGWQVAATTASKVGNPSALEREGVDFCPASAPSTVASALRAAGRWSIDDPDRVAGKRVDFDASDWWYRCTFESTAPKETAAQVLCFGGLATVAEVWLNGVAILQSDNMFVEHEVDVRGLLRPSTTNDLVICFRSVTTILQSRRPRPRWRTRLIESQQLRWVRTALLGRIPGWTPAAAPVGPYRAVTLETRSQLGVAQADVRARTAGADGVVVAAFVFVSASTSMCGGPLRVALHVGDSFSELECGLDESERIWARGEVRVVGAERWWPHTHGAQPRYPVHVVVTWGGVATRVDLGRVGFRSVELAHDEHAFAIHINDVPVFCRGACWTPVDVVALTATDAEYRTALSAVRAAGMNMVRVSGPFLYEEDAFYEACDDLGILVWQDYAFANMDYPGDDPLFVASVQREARGFLDRTQLSCALTVLCGNSEVEQQAAMMGAPRAIWRSPLFSQTLPEASFGLRPDVPYWPSTPSGGALPFVTDAGTTHYFGVGAYLRPLDDARRADVRFATECLAFANVPDPRAVDELMNDAGSPPQDPLWKRRTPRDSGAGWDFEDVRDHYLRALFDVDPLALRYADVSRYLALSRVVTGEVMAAAFSEWRREHSRCGGALVWFLRDLWPGAGWGIVDASGQPKAAYYALKRVLQPVAVSLIDEGLNGLDAHVVNDGPHAVEASLRFVSLRDGEVPVATAIVPVVVPARGHARVRMADALGFFFDATYAYRFGPPTHDVTVASLVDPLTGAVRGEAFHFVRGLPSRQEADVGLEAQASPATDGAFRVTLRSKRFAQAVALDVRGFAPDDNYFHVVPGSPREVLIRPTGAAGSVASTVRGTAQPLNARSGAKVVLSGSS